MRSPVLADATVPGWDEVPLLASEVTIDLPIDPSSRVVVSHTGVPVSRVSAPVGRLLRAMDGRTTLRRLKTEFAPDESAEDFLRLFVRFRRSGLLAGDGRKPPGRVAFRPPLTVQFSTLRAPALFSAIDRTLAPFTARRLLPPSAMLLVGGLIAMIAQLDLLWGILTAPVPLEALLIVAVALTLATMIHELAHGVTLTRFGESPRRAGLMFLYLSPAFFVDVTNGWRLPRRQYRVAVALAGPAVHAVLGGASFSAAWLVGDAAARTVLLMLGATSFFVVVVNLIPFVRFDGYLALMSWLDEPGLRARTMRDAGRFMRKMLFGGAGAPAELARWWSVPFGILSVATPAILVVYGLGRIARGLAGGGVVAGALLFALEGAVLVVLLLLLVRMLVGVWRSGASRIRILAVLSLLATIVAMSGLAIRLPVSVQAGFVSASGDVELVVADARSVSELVDGMHVDLLTNGMFANPSVGSGTLVREPLIERTVALDALFPVRVTNVTVPAFSLGSVDLHVAADPDLPSTGLARIVTGTENVWEQIWRSMIVEPGRMLTNAE